MYSLKNILQDFNFELGPYEIFDKKIVNFLDEISNRILKSKKYNHFTDLATFAFWCRKKNIQALSKIYSSNNLIVGRGCVLHICPSNVPMNFAYSLAFGLISGNNNIVKLPSKNYFQVKYLLEVINHILKKKKFASLKRRFKFIKYGHEEEISRSLSKIVNARLIWGGDETIKLFKKFETKPRCIDLCFSNRVSGSIINLDNLKKLNSKKLFNIVYKFYNDCYLMDQRGCSSPQVVFWLGKKNYKVVEKFWQILSNIVEKNYEFDLSLANKKTEFTSELVLKEKKIENLKFKNLKLVRYQKKNLDNIEKLENIYGTFLEVKLTNFLKIKKLIDERFQTLTYYGLEKEQLINLISKNNLRGIDRIVPFGRAFDMGHIWDGFDIISSLSRKIAE
jgi:hypothetical protein